jgi:4-amino-4-deoxy-L-arabinose transferase-like glycosyltransferase
VFVVALVALVVLRGEALTTPYFWDEVGYYVPNAVSMYRNGLDPIPTLTVPQSYPPLQPLTLVAGWWVLGFSIAASRVVTFAITAGAVALAFALGREVFDARVGLAAAALTLASPVTFGQAGFAQPETLLMLTTLWATLALVRGRMGSHAVAVAAMLMTKWTALVAFPAFGLYALWTAPTWREGLRRQLWYAPALVLLAGWFAYFYARVGTLTSKDANYAKVNLWDNLVPHALVFRGAIRVEQLVENDFAWLVAGPALVAGAWWCRRREPGAPVREVLLMSGVAAMYVAFLTVSGFLLPRYFVPVAPFVAILGAAGLYRLFSRPVATAALVAIVLVTHLGWYGRFAAGPALLDGRTAYLDFVATHVEAARYLEAHAPGARIAASWPVVDELRTPYFGYVTRPLETVPLDRIDEGFDVLYEAPVPQNPNPARETALRLGLVEVARFERGDQIVVLWGLDRHSTASGSDPKSPER